MVIYFRRKAIVLGVAVAVCAISSHAFGSNLRSARWKADTGGKGYEVLNYVYTNYLNLKSWDALNQPPNPKGPIKVQGEDHFQQFKVPFRPNDLHIKYEWQNAGFFPIKHNIRLSLKRGSFRWTFWKLHVRELGLGADASLSGPVDTVVVCQDEWEGGNETFCLNPTDPEAFDCVTDTCGDGNGTPFFPDQEDVNGSLFSNKDADPDAGACCGAEGCYEAPEEECTGPSKFRGIGTTCAEECPEAIPTVTEWGLVVMVLLVLAAGTIVIVRRRATTA